MENLPINIVDLVIVVVVVISGLWGFWRGFVHEALTVGSWIGAIFATLYAFPYATELASRFIPVDLIAQITAGVVTFIVVLAVLSLITRFLAGHVKQSGLGPLDRTLGLLFGFLRGAVVICLLWIGYNQAIPPEDWPNEVNEAKAIPLVTQGSVMLLALAPADLAEKGYKALRQIQNRADQLDDAHKAFQKLNSPLPKNGATAEEPEYNNEMRGALQRAIEDFSNDSESNGDQVQ